MTDTTWIDCLGFALAALEAADFPDDCICSHFGVLIYDLAVALPATIEIAPSFRGRGRRGTLVMMSDRNKRGGFTAEVFDDWRQGIATHDKIVEFWNGEAGHDSVSVVIDRPPAAGFDRAIENYHALPSPFNLSDENKARFTAFDEVWEAAYKTQRKAAR